LARLVKVAPQAELLIPSPREKECHHVHLNDESSDECCRGRSGWCFPFLPAFAGMAASGQKNPAFLTSHSPWLAPIGHRQPARADVPQDDLLSAWERQQQDLDVELDRKLVICRGC
jgi:hypothetical protein